MLVYPRSYAPFMPQGNANLTNAPSPQSATPTPMYAPGELGMVFADQMTGRVHQRVILDSGATSATATGVVAAGQLAFWKDQTNFIVTNHKPQCDYGPTGAINRVAGVFALAVTAGNYCDIVKAGRMTLVSDGSGVIGGTAMADTTASVARVVGGAAANTAPVSLVVGYNAAAPGASTTLVDVSLGFQGN